MEMLDLILQRVTEVDTRIKTIEERLMYSGCKNPIYSENELNFAIRLIATGHDNLYEALRAIGINPKGIEITKDKCI